MSEWWTYRPVDFLMFAPRTYWRLFELQNTAWWPLLPVLLLAAVAWLAWAAKQSRQAAPTAVIARIGAAGIALAWAFAAWSFLLERYAPINWAAHGFAVGFFAQALALAGLAALGDVRIARPGFRVRIGMLILAFALLGHPLLAVAFGRPWAQAEAFGLAPDPTVIATLGFLLMVDAQKPAAVWLVRWLWFVALLWCAISAVTLWTMESAQWWVVVVAALLALVAACWPRPAAGRPT